MSLQKTFLFVFLTTMLFVATFFIVAPQVSAADCTVAADFGWDSGDHGQGWYSQDFGKLITVNITTTDCVGEELSVSLVSRTATFNFTVDALNEKTYTVPSSGKIEIDLWIGETHCVASSEDSDDCEYHIKITGDDLEYSSHPDDLTSTPSMLTYECASLLCIDALLNPWELAETPESKCLILGATMNPSGVQAADFYQDEPRTPVDISIQTANCTGQTIEVSITRSRPGFGNLDYDVGNIDNRKITVSTNSTVTIKAVPGEDWCEEGNESGNDGCIYYLRVFNPIDVQFNFENTAIISYACDGTESGDSLWCYSPTKQTWYISWHNGVNSETGEAVYAGALPGPTLTEGDPCVQGTGADLSFEENCYALLAPIGDIKEIKGDITLGTYINMVVSIVIGLATLLAVVMVVVGGVQYMTTDALAGKSNARETITKALLGLVLALGSFLILKTINPQLLNVEPNIPDIYYGVDSPPELNSNGTYSTQDTTMQNITRNTSWSQVKTDRSLVDIRPSLPSGVTVNNLECELVGDSGCTSMYFTSSVAQSLLTKLGALRTACDDCNIVITGGSEFWKHRTHGPSRGVLDFSVNPGHAAIDLEDVLQLNEALSGQESVQWNNTEYTNFPGFTANDEPNPNHWHVF